MEKHSEREKIKRQNTRTSWVTTRGNLNFSCWDNTDTAGKKGKHEKLWATSHIKPINIWKAKFISIHEKYDENFRLKKVSVIESVYEIVCNEQCVSSFHSVGKLRK